jgi:hypothetical protein
VDDATFCAVPFVALRDAGAVLAASPDVRRMMTD